MMILAIFALLADMSVNKSFGSKKINLFTSETGRNRTEDLGNEITYVRLKRTARFRKSCFFIVFSPVHKIYSMTVCGPF